MSFVVELCFAIIVALGLFWFASKLQAWAARDKNTQLVVGNERVKDLCFFAAMGLVASALSFIQLVIKGIAWLIPLLV